MPAQLNASNNPTFDELCLLLRRAPGQRSLADCLRIGQLIDSFFPSDGPGEPARKDVYRQRFAVNLVEQLRENDIEFTTSTAYWYRRFFTCPDKAFLKACRKAERARWEDVMRLLTDALDPDLRLKLLDVAENQGDELSARAFKELVRLAARRGAMPGKRVTSIGHSALVAAARRLRKTASRAADDVAEWFGGTAPLADRLGNVRGVDPAAAGEARAALRLFRAAARRLGTALKPVTSSTARRTSAKTKRRGQPS